MVDFHSILRLEVQSAERTPTTLPLQEFGHPRWGSGVPSYPRAPV